MCSKPLQSSKNGATVLTLWSEPLRGETGLAPYTPWLKFGGICERRQCASGEPPSDRNQSSAPPIMDYAPLTLREAKNTPIVKTV